MEVKTKYSWFVPQHNTRIYNGHHTVKQCDDDKQRSLHKMSRRTEANDVANMVECQGTAHGDDDRRDGMQLMIAIEVLGNTSDGKRKIWKVTRKGSSKRSAMMKICV